MTINFTPVSFRSNLTANKTAFNPIRQTLNQIQYDSVSFTGVKKQSKEADKLTDVQLANSQNVKTASKLAKKISTQQDLSLKSLEEAFNKSSPVEIEVIDLKDKPAFLQLPPNTIAHMLPIYNNQNLELAKANILLNPNYGTAQEKTTLFADSMHEYTHVLQRNGDKTYYGMKAELKNTQEIQTAARISQAILGQVVNYYASTLSDSPMLQRAMQNGKYQFSSGEVEKCCTNGKEPKDTTEKIISSTLDRICSAQDVGIEKETLKKLVKNFIKQEALNEAEAYTVTLETLKRAGNFDRIIYTKRNLNQGIYTTIYNSID